MRAEPAAGRRRHDRDRDHDRERDGDGDRQREVGEDLSFDVLQEQHRQEHGDRRRRRGEQRGHDLSRAVVRRLLDRHAAFLQSDDVAGDDDRAFDDHADGEREAGERDDVDAATGEVRARRTSPAGRPESCVAIKTVARASRMNHHTHSEREQCADDEVLDQQIDGALDEQRCIERLLDAQAALLERPVAQLRDDLLHFFERAEHVRARRAQDAQADRGIAVLIGEEAGDPAAASRRSRDRRGAPAARRATRARAARGPRRRSDRCSAASIAGVRRRAGRRRHSSALAAWRAMSGMPMPSAAARARSSVMRTSSGGPP